MSRVVPVLAVVACSSIVVAQQPPARDRPAASTGTAMVTGRVTEATGRALARAEIRLGNGEGQQANGLTDADGRYDLGQLPAGTYTVTASKPNYVRSAWGEQRPEGPGKRITLAEGQRLDNINFRLVRAGAIAGRIVDEFGDPITDVMVSAMRYQYVQGTRRLMPSGRSGQTNDLGDFRVYGLSPGQYYLSATLRNFAGNSDTTDRSGYAPTFYPGTGNPAEAQRLAISAGQTIVGTNLTLLPIRTARVSGIVHDIDGKPMAAGMVMVAPKSPASGFGMSAFPFREDGRFTINGLTPGDYILRIGGAGAGADAAVAEVSVNGSDIDNLDVVAARPSTIRGRIVFVPDEANAPPKTTTMDLGAVREWAMAQPVRSPARIKDDGTFEISLPAGHVVLRAAPVPIGGRGSASWRLNRVLYHDSDVGDTGIDIPPNAAVDDVMVEMTSRSAELIGRVTDGDGTAVRDCFVIVFAQDPSRWTVQTRYVGVARPGNDDRYHVRLLAGEYYAVAMSGVEPNAWTDPDFLSGARDHAVKLTIVDGESGKTLDLPLSPAPVF